MTSGRIDISDVSKLSSKLDGSTCRHVDLEHEKSGFNRIKTDEAVLKSRIKSGIVKIGIVHVKKNIERVDSFERFVRKGK